MERIPRNILPNPQTQKPMQTEEKLRAEAVCCLPHQWTITFRDDGSFCSDPEPPKFLKGHEIELTFRNLSGHPVILGIIAIGRRIKIGAGGNSEPVDTHSRHCWLPGGGEMDSGIVPLVDRYSITLPPFKVADVETSSEQNEFTYSAFAIEPAGVDACRKPHHFATPRLKAFGKAVDPHVIIN